MWLQKQPEDHHRTDSERENEMKLSGYKGKFASHFAEHTAHHNLRYTYFNFFCNV